MSVLLTVKSENESLKNSLKNYLNDMLIASGYIINKKTPDFDIEVIIKDIYSDFVVLSVNYAIYYYLWNYLKIKPFNEKLNEDMFHISYKCELDNKYSAGVCGIYKHNVYHNIGVFKKDDIEEVCSALVSDFHDMVITWKDQTIASTEIMSKIIGQDK